MEYTTQDTNQVLDYTRNEPTISYAQDRADGLNSTFIRAIEVLMGRRKVESIYRELKRSTVELNKFFESGIDRAGIDIQVNEENFELVPKSGPLVFVANHPFGVVDGAVLCDLALKTRGEFKILVHSMLCQDSDFAGHFLPINFDLSAAAKMNNIRTKKLASEYLEQDGTLIVFPGGEVSTANRFGLGDVQEAPWTTFTAKLIQKTGASVVPVFFHGRNSRLFHIASHINLNVRTGLLIREVLTRFNKPLKMELGLPIPFEQLEMLGGRKAMTRFLYQQTMALGLENCGVKSS